MVGIPGTKPSASPPSTSRIGYGVRRIGARTSSAAIATSSASRTRSSCAPKLINATIRIARHDAHMQVELRDVAPGLWVWRVEHPAWQSGLDWGPLVASTCVESGGETLVLDPLAPPEAAEVWERFDARAPTAAVVLKPDHVREVDLFVRRYGARAFGPSLFWRDDIPETDPEPI